MRAKVQETNSSDHVMRLALKFREHCAGFVHRGGLPKASITEANERVGAENKAIRMLLGHSAGLAIGIQLTNLVRGEVQVLQFRDVAGDYFKCPAHVP